YTTGNQQHAAVAMDPLGNFVVVWSSYGSSSTDTNSYSVQGQRFSANGTTAGGQFQVNTYTTGIQEYPRVAVDVAGDFVVVWSGSGSGGTDTAGSSAHGQRFAANGGLAGGEFQLNSYTTGQQ